MMSHEQKPLKEALAPILDVLKQLGGKFTFMDEEGTQFVLASADVLEGAQKQEEQQLSFPQADSVAKALRKHVDSSLADDVIDRVNRDIALAASAEHEEDEIEDVIDAEEASLEEAHSYNPPKPPRIRFEPIKGDLAPELQE